MGLTSGTRLGSYEIVSPIGAGGMGEVYRARDSKLNRDVAIKVLPESLAQDPATLARFEREAHAVAALSHPNILAIHDFASERGITYAVTELLEGQTLRERLQSPIASRKAVEIAISVARGVAAAHERGIIHRDLKPENIFLTNDGVVKILDFGLAKAVPDAGRGFSRADPGDSPTVISSSTEAGVILGTVGYMAPEQVRGHAVDARADLFALGAILYEMLSGDRAFIRETAAETMTAILKEEPADFAPNGAINPALDRIVRHCLEKQPAHRFQTARDVAFALETLSTASPSAPVIDSAAIAAHGRTGTRERPLWAAATLALAAVVAWLGLNRPAETTPDAGGVRRASLILPADHAFRPNQPGRRIAISPDGQRVAYVLAKRGDPDTTLFVHSLEAGSAVAVPDSADADAPFWSPDGRTLAFLQDGVLMTVDAAGGKPTRRIGSANPGTWGTGGDILATEATSRTVKLLSSGAGEWRNLTGAPAGVDGIAVYPTWLPDGRRFVLVWGPVIGQPSTYLADTAGAPWQKLVDLNVDRESTNLTYVSGHLVNARDQMIVARSFDPDGPTIGSETSYLAGPVDVAGRGSAAYAISESVLVYQPQTTQATTRLVWYDRSGARLSSLSEDAAYSNLELSPDGKQLLVGILDAATRQRDLWVVDVRRGVRSRVTSDPVEERSASWFPDSASIAYHRNRDLFFKPMGAGAGRPLVVDGRSKDPRGVSPNGKFLIYRVSTDTMANDIWIKPLAPEGEARPLIASAFNETYAEISPDGRWLAYVTDKNGKSDVYVTAFPSGTGEVLVSPSGGTVPKWGRDGKELFYLSLDREMMRANVRTSGPTFEVDNAVPLFKTEADRGPGPQFIVTNDGQRFLVNSEVPTTDQGTLNVVFNWRALLKKK
jgi:Tol biopolymer transport system component